MRQVSRTTAQSQATAAHRSAKGRDGLCPEDKLDEVGVILPSDVLDPVVLKVARLL
jgi:hypothetical protein